MTGHSDQTPVIEVTIGAPVSAVWRSLREPELIRNWHGWHYDEGTGLDGEIEVIFGHDARVVEDGRVLELPDGDRFELSEVDGGTKVRIVRCAVPDDPEWAKYYDDITEGWRSFSQQLRFMLEQHPDQERSTIFLSGAIADADLDHLLAGIPAEASDVWFETEHQRGVVLAELGPGLLIVAVKPADVGTPTAMAIVTMYGVQGSELAHQHTRWTAWWKVHAIDEDASPR